MAVAGAACTVNFCEAADFDCDPTSWSAAACAAAASEVGHALERGIHMGSWSAAACAAAAAAAAEVGHAWGRGILLARMLESPLGAVF